jgi:hypothetical protein
MAFGSDVAWHAASPQGCPAVGNLQFENVSVVETGAARPFLSLLTPAQVLRDGTSMSQPNATLVRNVHGSFTVAGAAAGCTAALGPGPAKRDVDISVTCKP